MTRSTKTLAVVVLASIALPPADALGRELVPFPSQQQQQQQQQFQGYYLTAFKWRIEKMDCEQLQAVKNKLALDLRDASNWDDQEYFKQLIGAVDQRSKAVNCSAR